MVTLFPYDDCLSLAKKSKHYFKQKQERREKIFNQVLMQFFCSNQFSVSFRFMMSSTNFGTKQRRQTQTRTLNEFET